MRGQVELEYDSGILSTGLSPLRDGELVGLAVAVTFFVASSLGRAAAAAAGSDLGEVALALNLLRMDAALLRCSVKRLVVPLMDVVVLVRRFTKESVSSSGSSLPSLGSGIGVSSNAS